MRPTKARISLRSQVSQKRSRLCENSEARPYVGVEREQRHSILELDDQFFDFSHSLGRLRYMLIGYARVSKADGSQSLDLQRDALRAEGIDDPANLYHDFASGVRDDRPGLDSCLGAPRKGDVLVVWKLGRLGRPRSLGAGRSRSRRPHPSSASDSTNRTRSACRERECFW